MFTKGFNKIASEKAKAIAAAAGLLAGGMGVGALTGHQMHVHKKIMNARAGKDYKEKSFIDKHPKTTGALSLGLAPSLSAAVHQRELDMANPKVRKVMKDHPFVTGVQ